MDRRGFLRKDEDLLEVSPDKRPPRQGGATVGQIEVLIDYGIYAPA
ncbi:MAG TPA: hypothetical protein VFA33_21220 [Bryobacteraceae bacterium]|nr:hypothetical protein [Bryobacteraceae bacterium]